MCVFIHLRIWKMYMRIWLNKLKYINMYWYSRLFYGFSRSCFKNFIYLFNCFKRGNVYFLITKDILNMLNILLLLFSPGLQHVFTYTFCSPLTSGPARIAFSVRSHAVAFTYYSLWSHSTLGNATILLHSTFILSSSYRLSTAYSSEIWLWLSLPFLQGAYISFLHIYKWRSNYGLICSNMESGWWSGQRAGFQCRGIQCISGWMVFQGVQTASRSTNNNGLISRGS